MLLHEVSCEWIGPVDPHNNSLLLRNAVIHSGNIVQIAFSIQEKRDILTVDENPGLLEVTDQGEDWGSHCSRCLKWLELNDAL